MRFRPIVPAIAPRTFPEPWRNSDGEESLGALSLRNNSIESQFRVDLRVVLLLLADVFV